MSTERRNSDARQALGAHGLFVILAATALALLSTPLAAPAMPEIAKVFADNAQNEPFARAILAAISILPGEPSVIFLVKFILLSIPALFIILGAPVVGWLSDNIGRKPLLNVSLLIFGIAGTSGYFAESFFFLFMGRAILGLSIAGIKTATVAMVGDYYEGAARNRVIGWQGSAMKFGGVIFMLLGGFLANFNWQVPFLGYMLAFVILPSGFIALSQHLPAARASTSIDDKALPAIPVGSATYVFISAFLASALFFITPVQLPFFLRNAFDATPFEMGAAIALGNTIGALTSLTYHQFRNHMNFVAIYAVIFVSMALGYFVVASATSYALALLGMVIAGTGFGLYVPNQSSWILSIVSQKRRGFGVGIVTTAMFLGQFSAPILVQPFIDPTNPAAVWTAVSYTLFGLAVLYVVLSRFSSRHA
jgi:MFS family permease